MAGYGSQVHAATTVALLSMLFMIAIPLGAAVADERGTAAEAQAMVARAIESFDADGAEQTFAEIDAQDPAFRDRDLYVFVIGPDRRIVAHAGDVKRIGIDLRDVRDHNERPYGQMILHEASTDGVWVDYERLDYLSNEVLPKSSWVVRHMGYIFGVGIYKG